MADETLQHDTTLATPDSPRVADSRVTDDQHTDSQYTGNQVGDNRVADSRVTDNQYTDNQVSDNRVADGQVERQSTQSQFTDREVAELRRRLDEDSGDRGGNRFGWFLIGFLAALLSITVAAVVFLAVSDRDDDGNINLDVPAVNVEG